MACQEGVPFSAADWVREIALVFEYNCKASLHFNGVVQLMIFDVDIASRSKSSQ